MAGGVLPTLATVAKVKDADPRSAAAKAPSKVSYITQEITGPRRCCTAPTVPKATRMRRFARRQIIGREDVWRLLRAVEARPRHWRVRYNVERDRARRFATNGSDSQAVYVGTVPQVLRRWRVGDALSSRSYRRLGATGVP
jgi:hypothetical protein